MRKWVKGSLTVEASFIVSLTIIVVGIMLSLWIYKYQLCWYTQAVCECLLTGSNIGVLNETDCIENIEVKWDEVKVENYLIPKNLSVQIEGDENEICMKVTGKTSVWGSRALEIKIEQEAKIVKPVEFIRKIAAVKE